MFPVKFCYNEEKRIIFLIILVNMDNFIAVFLPNNEFFQFLRLHSKILRIDE